MILRVAWRNLWRRRKRTLLTSLAMGVGVALSMATMSLQKGVYLEVFDEMVTDSLGHVQLHHPNYPQYNRMHETIPHAEALARAAEKVKGASMSVQRLFTAALAGGLERSAGALVTGVEPEREARLSELDREVTEGRWLASQAQGEAVLGYKLAQELKLSVGQELALIGQDNFGGMASELFKVVGLVSSGAVEMDEAGVWVHLHDAQALLVLEGQAHEVLVVGRGEAVAEDLDALKELKRQVAELEGGSEFSVQGLSGKKLSVRTWREARPSLGQMMDTQRASSLIMLMVVLAVSALGVLNTMLMAVFERSKELGLMLALGVSPARVGAMVVSEALLLASLSAVVGGALGGALNLYLARVGVDFSVNGEGLSYGGIRLSPVIKGVWSWSDVGVALSALMIVTLVASLWPAFKAARMHPITSLKERD
jgi:ABC-type lipoprotein release transport system permease subunit